MAFADKQKRGRRIYDWINGRGIVFERAAHKPTIFRRARDTTRRTLNYRPSSRLFGLATNTRRRARSSSTRPARNETTATRTCDRLLNLKSRPSGNSSPSWNRFCSSRIRLPSWSSSSGPPTAGPWDLARPSMYDSRNASPLQNRTKSKLTQRIMTDDRPIRYTFYTETYSTLRYVICFNLQQYLPCLALHAEYTLYNSLCNQN